MSTAGRLSIAVNGLLAVGGASVSVLNFTHGEVLLGVICTALAAFGVMVIAIEIWDARTIARLRAAARP